MLSEIKFRVRTQLRLAESLEEKACRWLNCFLAGKYCFSKKQLYDLLDRHPNSLVAIVLPGTGTEQVAGVAGWKRLQFNSCSQQFLGEEWIKEGPELFSNGNRSGLEYVFVKNNTLLPVKSTCLENIMSFISDANKQLDQCDDDMKDLDKLLIDSIANELNAQICSSPLSKTITIRGEK